MHYLGEILMVDYKPMTCFFAIMKWCIPFFSEFPQKPKDISYR